MPFDTVSLKSTHSSTSSYSRSIFSEDDKLSNNTVLYSELRLIERNEGDINACWKGAHMMLFFMAFVFGSLCTCCFHRVMYMFDEKCVLFPKVVSHSSIHRIVYEFFSYKPITREGAPEIKGTNYFSTQWADNSVCYLPTYVPLVSGLAGLVWTTMFLMCSSGTSNVTGAERHWRALPAMFFFSITMSVLCIYASCVTHSGLRELCLKMAEATGYPSTCTYSINVATLVYDRRIHGVYQAARLSIVSAWLHTCCWVLSTLLIAARVLLAVDFTLVHVKAQLVGNMDDILQKHEEQLDSLNAESTTPLKFDIDEDDSEVELFATENEMRGPNKTTFNVPNKPEQTPQLAQSPTLSPEGRHKVLGKYMRRILINALKAVEKRDQDTQTNKRFDTNKPKELTDAGITEWKRGDIIQKIRGKLSKENNEIEPQSKSSLKIDKNVDEGKSRNVDDGRREYEELYKVSENKIAGIKNEEIEQRSSREIYKMNFEESLSEKTEQKDNDNRHISLQKLNYDTNSYDNLKITKEISKTDDEKKSEKNEVKDEKTELKDVENKEKVHVNEQHDMSDDANDNNESAPAEGNDETVNKKQKEENKKGDVRDGKGPQDKEDKNKEK